MRDPRCTKRIRARCQSCKTCLSVSIMAGVNKLERLSLKSFQDSLVFASKTGAYLSGVPHTATFNGQAPDPTHQQQTFGKKLLLEDTLAYFASMSVTKKKKISNINARCLYKFKIISLSQKLKENKLECFYCRQFQPSLLLAKNAEAQHSTRWVGSCSMANVANTIHSKTVQLIFPECE